MLTSGIEIFWRLCACHIYVCMVHSWHMYSYRVGIAYLLIRSLSVTALFFILFTQSISLCYHCFSFSFLWFTINNFTVCSIFKSVDVQIYQNFAEVFVIIVRRISWISMITLNPQTPEIFDQIEPKTLFKLLGLVFLFGIS